MIVILLGDKRLLNLIVMIVILLGEKRFLLKRQLSFGLGGQNCSKNLDDDCDFIDDEIYEIDLFEGYLTLKLNNAYVPDFNFTDSLLNDYYYLKFSNFISRCIICLS